MALSSTASAFAPGAAVPPAPPVRRATRTPHADRLSGGQQAIVAGFIVVLHVALGWAVLQVSAVREALAEASPVFASLITPDKPALPEPPPPPPPPPRVVPLTPPLLAPVIVS